MKYLIKTERLIIRLAKPEDAEDISSYRSDFAENKYQGWFPGSVEEVVIALVICRKQWILAMHVFSLPLFMLMKTA